MTSDNPDHAGGYQQPRAPDLDVDTQPGEDALENFDDPLDEMEAEARAQAEAGGDDPDRAWESSENMEGQAPSG